MKTIDYIKEIVDCIAINIRVIDRLDKRIKKLEKK